MFKKILVTSLIYSILTISVFSAGSSGGDSDTENKSNYDKALKIVRYDRIHLASLLS